MRYVYRNTTTGAEFESNCEISAPNLIKVGADAPIIEPHDVDVEPEQETPKPKPKAPAKATKTSAKKTVKKGAKK